jgi:hypothetical protein
MEATCRGEQDWREKQERTREMQDKVEVRGEAGYLKVGWESDGLPKRIPQPRHDVQYGVP